MTNRLTNLPGHPSAPIRWKYRQTLPTAPTHQMSGEPLPPPLPSVRLTTGRNLPTAGHRPPQSIPRSQPRFLHPPLVAALIQIRLGRLRGLNLPLSPALLQFGTLPSFWAASVFWCWALSEVRISKTSLGRSSTETHVTDRRRSKSARQRVASLATWKVTWQAKHEACLFKAQGPAAVPTHHQSWEKYAAEIVLYWLNSVNEEGV